MRLYTGSRAHGKGSVSKERPQPPKRLTFEEVTRQARETTLEHGGHVPMLIVEGSEQTVIVRIEDLASDSEGRRRQMFELGFTLAQKDLLGMLDQVFFICEAWMSQATDKEGTMPPSEDPKRKEIMLISHLDTRNNTDQVAVFEMIRTAHGKLKRLQELDRQGMQINSPLLLVLIHGYAIGLLRGLSH
jgi:hypothetical protein